MRTATGIVLPARWSPVDVDQQALCVVDVDFLVGRKAGLRPFIDRTARAWHVIRTALAIAREDAGVGDAPELMRHKGVRRIAVLAHSRALAGILTIDGVLDIDADQRGDVVHATERARAHGLGRTRDWVIVYFYDDEHAEGQHTIVTETRGALAGKRVVRGREAECRAHYATLENHVAAAEGAR